MHFEIPDEIQRKLIELDAFIEREIEPLQRENMQFFDHRREWARTDFENGGTPRPEWEALLREMRRRADAAGHLRYSLPKALGGQDGSNLAMAIIREHLAAKGLGLHNDLQNESSIVGNFPSVIMMLRFGTDAQKSEFLDGMITGTHRLGFGLTEPDHGSDATWLETTGVRDGSEWVINGQKIWTSGAHRADMIGLLARTDQDAPNHKGISYFLVDMKSPGISVQPLTNMADMHSFNEVFFENVRVPKTAILGELNRGWYVATTTLDFERSSIGSAVGLRLQVENLIDFALEHVDDHQSTIGHQPTVRYELADRLMATQVARMLSYRVVSMQNKGMVPNYEASMTKLFASELNQRVARTSMKVAGLYGQLMPGSEWAPARGRYGSSYIQTLASTIAGGTSEVQRGIIATRGLGLPKN